MKTEITTESTGVMIPNEANAMRVHTSWYTRLQKPETKNSRNNNGRRLGLIFSNSSDALIETRGRPTVNH